jgi:dolichol-phosphate mannosyltransferase
LSKHIAVVIPTYNEAGNRAADPRDFAAVPKASLQEVVVVDDAGDDGTDDEIKATRYQALRYLRHGAGAPAKMRRCAAGYRRHSSGHRHHGRRRAERPGGYHAAGVAAWPQGRRTRSRWRLAGRAQGQRLAQNSCFADWIRDKVLADGCPDIGCGLKVYRRDDYLNLPYFTSMHPYLPALLICYGHEIAYERVNDRPRLKGASKYINLGRALIGLL